MNREYFIQELFNDLSSIDEHILGKLYNMILDDKHIKGNLNRFTFEKEKILF